MSDMDDVLTALDDGDDRPAPETVVPGNVDVTATFGDAVVRVRTVDDVVLLTIAGPDGMATARLSELDADLLGDLLSKAERDLIRTRRDR